LLFHLFVSSKRWSQKDAQRAQLKVLLPHKPALPMPNTLSSRAPWMPAVRLKGTQLLLWLFFVTAFSRKYVA